MSFARVEQVALSNAKPEGAKGKYIKVRAAAHGASLSFLPSLAHLVPTLTSSSRTRPRRTCTSPARWARRCPWRWPQSTRAPRASCWRTLRRQQRSRKRGEGEEKRRGKRNEAATHEICAQTLLCFFALTQKGLARDGEAETPPHGAPPLFSKFQHCFLSYVSKCPSWMLLSFSRASFLHCLVHLCYTCTRNDGPNERRKRPPPESTSQSCDRRTSSPLNSVCCAMQWRGRTPLHPLRCFPACFRSLTTASHQETSKS